jgi:hypothetical protein
MATTATHHPETAISPAAASAADPKAGEAQLLRPKINILESLIKHRFLAFVLMLIAAGIALPAAWILGTPTYAATAVIYVSPRFVSNLAEGGEQRFESATQYRDYVQQNARTINRFDIVLEALKRLGPLNADWVRPGETMERAATRLQTALVILTPTKSPSSWKAGAKPGLRNWSTRSHPPIWKKRNRKNFSPATIASRVYSPIEPVCKRRSTRSRLAAW